MVIVSFRGDRVPDRQAIAFRGHSRKEAAWVVTGAKENIVVVHIVVIHL